MDEDYLPDTQSQPDSCPSYSQNDKGPGEVAKAWGRLYAWKQPMEHVDLFGTSITLGRATKCDIIIHKSKFPESHCTTVSKEHFVITKDGPDSPAVLTDLSKNGTFINDIPLKSGGSNCSRILQNNDIISIAHKNLKTYLFKQFSSEDTDFLPEMLREKYIVAKEIGRGAVGVVHLAYEKSTCNTYAIKRITKGRYATSQQHQLNHPKKIQTEISILMQMSMENYPFVIGIKEYADTETDVFLVLEYMKGGELTRRITPTNFMTESQVKYIFLQILYGVQYLHKRGIIHRDLKPDNVLLSSECLDECIAKISDFGLSKILDEKSMMETICGTKLYVAPEILDSRYPKYTEKVDVWSLGVILYYMLCGYLPFYSPDVKTLHVLIMTGTVRWDYSSWTGISKVAKDLISKMLVVNPDKRFSVDDVFKHPWIDEDVAMQYRVQEVGMPDPSDIPKKRQKLDLPLPCSTLVDCDCDNSRPLSDGSKDEYCENTSPAPAVILDGRRLVDMLFDFIIETF